MVRRTIDLPRVRTHSQDLEDFDPKRIKEVFMKEAGLSSAKASYYTKMILIDLERLYLRGKLKVLTTRMIRELMCAYAIQEGDFETRDRLTVLGMPLFDVEKLFFKYNFDNSNQIPSEEFLHKMKGDWMDDEYSLLKLYNFDTKWGNPAYHHLNGDVHIHDRDYPARPFCYQHSARFIFRNGLRIDGTGKYCNVSRRPKKLGVAVKLMCEFLGAASRNWSGGQSFRNPFWELGPYIEAERKKCKDTKEIWGVDIPKSVVQAAQVMRYEPNHILVGRGSQAAFSSISNFARPPMYLTDDTDVVLPGGKVVKGDYSAYTEDVLKFWLAYLHESVQGDAAGGMFHWMKDDVGIKPKWFKDDELKQFVFEPLMKYIAKFGGPYIHNLKNVNEEEVACTSCCSLVLASKDPIDFELAKQGTLGMGALQCGSINLPRIAYRAKGDDAEVDEILYNNMNVLREMMMAKYKFMDKIIKAGVTPFFTQSRIPGKDDNPYFELDKQSMLLSFVGLNEFAKAHLGQELHESRDAHKYGMRIVQRMLKICDEFSKKEGINFSIWRQPAETVAGRFARLDYKKFNGDAVINGDPKVGAGYYSNFTHVNVNSGVDVFGKIKQEAPFHGLSPSNLMHIWLGESRPDPDALWELTKKIIDKSITNYFAYTKDISVCTKCNSAHGGVVGKCKCGAGPEDISVQSRVTGYYSTVGNVAGILDWRQGKHKTGLKHAHWQPSKFSEFNDRLANMSGRRFSHLEAE